jgi:hypothetical protein
MIKNDKEFQVTQERITTLERVLLQLRLTAEPQEFASVSNGYLAELEKMQREVREYLGRLDDAHTVAIGT